VFALVPPPPEPEPASDGFVRDFVVVAVVLPAGLVATFVVIVQLGSTLK
jgi:hypothetical protein